MGCGASKAAPMGSAVDAPKVARRLDMASSLDIAPPCGAATRHDAHVSRAAVSLAWLQQLAAREGMRDRGVTTGDLVMQIVKPATADARCRYTDLLLREPALQGAVSQGRPFYFISHTWSRPFAETLDMLASHFEPERQRVWRQKDGQPLPPLAPHEVFVWFDIFAVNQHMVGQENSDLAALCEAVVDAQETLMVLDPEGVLVTRIWCLYEAWQSSRAGMAKLRLLSYGIMTEQLEKVFIDLDVSCAEAAVEADRVRILADIERDVGSLHDMTHRLKDVLVAGTVAQVPPVDSEWTHFASFELATAAWLCELYGRLDDAEPLSRRALECRERVLGPDHPDTLTAVNNLAALMQTQGKLEEAERLQRRALEGKERILGPMDPETLTTVNNLAGVLGAQGKMDEAEPLLRRALEGRERVLGPNHHNTLGALNNLAHHLQLQGKFDEAEPLCRRVVEGLERVLGPSHPDTFASLNNLGQLLQSQGKLDEVEPLLKRALEGSERVLGPNHPDTLLSVKNLADPRQRQDRVEEAESLYRRAVEGYERVLGPEHQYTSRSIRDLADLLRRQGRMEEADRLNKPKIVG